MRESWLAQAHGLGESLTVRLPAATLEGRFADLDDDGALLLVRAGGPMHRITAGEVFFRSSETEG